MNEQKILDKLAVIRENIKAIPESEQIPLLEDIESEIVELMNEISGL